MPLLEPTMLALILSDNVHSLWHLVYPLLSQEGTIGGISIKVLLLAPLSLS